MGSQMPRPTSDALRLVASVGAVGLVTLAYAGWLGVSNAAIVSTTYLLVVLVVAATSRFAVAAMTSVVAILCFNYFFLPPVGTWTIAEAQNWVALFALLAVSLVASNLSAAARARADEAIGRRNELARLFDLSRDILAMTASRDALSWLARSVARRFDLEFVANALPRAAAGWDVFDAGRPTALDEGRLTDPMNAALAAFDFDARTRTYSGHTTLSVGEQALRLVPLRVGTKPIGLLAAGGRPVEPGTLDALAGLVALAIERARFLEDRKVAELTRHSEELKTALLASLGHDLRTPLAAIRVAATNIGTAAPAQPELADQTDVILTEAERLSRLFDNILEMARIDAGSVETEARWTHPTEIIDAARTQVGQALAGHAIRIQVEHDPRVRLDGRLTASAVAHLLENAAQYSPAGTPIEVVAEVTTEGLTFSIRDHGPGIAPGDLPHVFDRFYRGSSAFGRTSGTGMGLSIARELLAVGGGRIRAQNAPGGGAEFTVVVPAATRPVESPVSPLP